MTQNAFRKTVMEAGMEKKKSQAASEKIRTAEEIPRKAGVTVTYSRKVKSKKAGGAKKRPASVMAEYNSGFTYTDSASGESDTISIELINTDMRWANRWMPKKGDKLTAKITERNWRKQGQKKTFYCGKFCLDDISYSGPELTCRIGGVSVPEGNAFRCTERNKTWENVTLKEIAAEISGKYHLNLHYTGNTIRLGKAEQSGETDSSFLKKLCDDYGMAFKIYCGKVVIYDKEKFEAKKPAVTLTKADLQKWSYNTTLTGTYTGAKIAYTSDEDDQERKCVVGGGKRILNINEKAGSLQEAQLKACARVNTENEKSVTMSITIMADTRIAAGCTVRIKGLCRLSGKYFVDQVTHNLGPDEAYTMDLELHKCQKRISTKTDQKGKGAGNTGTAEAAEFAVNDKVIVNGPAWWGGNGGKSNQCSNVEMYITEILGSGYQYQYGVAKRRGGSRYGWCSRESLRKV